MKLHFSLSLPREDVAVGVVAVSGVSSAPASTSLCAALSKCITERRAPLDPLLESRRLACRGMLRNGRYRPTGRAKPASEYLLRAAVDATFPSINGLVDANNLVSLEQMLPISLWDVDRARALEFHFRLGAEGESYVFNSGGQSMALCDLVVGCSVHDTEAGGEPIVNPVKDSLGTKTTDHTKAVAAAIYCPLSARLGPSELGRIAAELLGWLEGCGDDATGAAGVLLPHGELSLSLGRGADAM